MVPRVTGLTRVYCISYVIGYAISYVIGYAICYAAISYVIGYAICYAAIAIAIAVTVLIGDPLNMRHLDISPI